MTENGQHSDVKWSPAAFRALRDAMKRPPGIVTLKLWPEMPEQEVTLDLSGITALVLAGKFTNQMIDAKEQATREAIDHANKNQESALAWRELTQTVLEQHDYILGGVIISPKYYMLDQLPPGNQPDDGLTVYDFKPEMRWAIINVLQNEGGGEALANFRADPVGYAATFSSERLREDAGGDATTAGDTTLDQNSVQSGDLVEGAGERTRDVRRSDKRGERERKPPIETEHAIV